MNLARRNSIKKLIEEKGRVSFDELVKRYPTVSTMTIRRDLLALEEAGSLIRVRGGAVSVKELNRNVEDVYTQRTGYNIDAKKEIAKKAAEFADRGHSIFIDSGSTMLYFTKELLDINYYVTTNGLNIAQELSSKTMPVVTFIGGVINKRNMSASGTLSQVFLDNINGVFPVVGELARQYIVQTGPDRIEVGAGVQISTEGLFRCDKVSRTGQFGCFGGAFVFIYFFGNTEVHHFGLALRVD